MPRPEDYMTPEKMAHHAELLSNRVVKRYDHFRKRFARQTIDCFRLYDWDIPEVRAVVDWYAGHLVVAEYERLQTGPAWLPAMARAVGEALGVPSEQIHIKRRRTKQEGVRYEKGAATGRRIEVRERHLKFLVNLDDYLDTGLFSDHRDTRVVVGGLAKDQDFLNLFAYTGAFTCAAAAGGARSTTSVDRSQTHLAWAQANMQLNSLTGGVHRFVQSDVESFLTARAREGRRFSLAVVDPPSFFQDTKRKVSFDINRDHPRLIRLVLNVMTPGGQVFFSTNHQRFVPQLVGLPAAEVKEITPSSIPEDYRNRQIHRCWRITCPKK